MTIALLFKVLHDKKNPETIIKNATILDYRADSVCCFFKYSNFPGFNSGSLSIIGLEDYEQLNNYPPEDFTPGGHQFFKIIASSAPSSSSVPLLYILLSLFLNHLRRRLCVGRNNAAILLHDGPV